jgi:hypothetical protein
MPRRAQRAHSAAQLVAGGGAKTVSVAVQPPTPDCTCGMARRVCVDVDLISADRARRTAVPIFVCIYAVVAEGTCAPP